MPAFLDKLLKILQSRRGKDMRFMCRHLLSERGEASQTALAQEIINTYGAMDSAQRLQFFEMLCTEFSPDPAAIHRAAAEYHRSPMRRLSRCFPPLSSLPARNLSAASIPRRVAWKLLLPCENTCSKCPPVPST